MYRIKYNPYHSVNHNVSHEILVAFRRIHKGNLICTFSRSHEERQFGCKLYIQNFNPPTHLSHIQRPPNDAYQSVKYSRCGFVGGWRANSLGS